MVAAMSMEVRRGPQVHRLGSVSSAVSSAALVMRRQSYTPEQRLAVRGLIIEPDMEMKWSELNFQIMDWRQDCKPSILSS